MLTFVSHGPAGSGPSLMMAALAEAVRAVQPDLEIRTVDLPARDGAEAITHLGERPGDATVLGSCTPTYLTTPLKQDLPWRAADFTAVAGLVQDTYLLAVRTDHPRAGLDSLFDAPTVAAAAPYGGNTHIQALLVGDQVPGVDVRIVDSPAAAVEEVAAGTADWTTGVGSDFAAGLRDGRLRVIGTFAEHGTPDRPALADAGIDVRFPLWRGVVAPPGLAASDLAAWERLLAGARRTPPWRDYVTGAGMQDADWDSAGFREVLDREQVRYAAWIDRLGH
ncbi:tripartite tricarboxylate transporter substrate-binding protein [Nakamurella endophytica]|uniref:C4-dicarboxylate ABC transporter substrate-binding protein n=1 Tax=Nakamurella endophytica TaxID=1748367 RepID=A0A917WEH7_9ACTN|nr:tripartite tricarboxylate transporter substrate-binding protein [Nakamurella endophytica]GGL98118.1 C4-dicarboxylate ABC transporter substrate-binding protein [Nakamurella endophytica]